jgi:glucose/arabinose dehydrogenase
MKKYLLLLNLLFIPGVFSQTIAIQPYVTGLSSPVHITHPVNDSRLFVVQQGGIIKIVNQNGATGSLVSTAFLNVSSLISTGGERGLLGLAFHPQYATNGYFYINYTNTNGNTVIARYSVSTTNANVADATSGVTLMTINQPYANHNGGCLQFGPDGYLYIGMGDGGSADDPQNRAQNKNENLGKMLRLDVNVTTAPYYSSPSTNPYVGIAGNDEIWAIGMRNPWKFTFNRLNGDLWIGDVGQNNIEEIDFVAAPQTPGLNFGWRCYEGNAAYISTGGTCPAASGVTMPVAQYTHSEGCSITGGYIYTGTVYPNFLNKYFFADYCNNRLGYVNTINDAITYTPNFSGSNNFTTFGEDKDGELYVTGGSVIYKIVDTSLANSAFEKNGFSIYPNPSKGEFSIKNANNTSLTKVELYDLSGKLLLSQSTNLTQSISTNSLSSGMYIVFVEIVSGEKFSSKIIVE